MTTQIGLPTLAPPAGGGGAAARRQVQSAYAARQRDLASDPISPTALRSLRLAQAALLKMDVMCVAAFLSDTCPPSLPLLLPFCLPFITPLYDPYMTPLTRDQWPY